MKKFTTLFLRTSMFILLLVTYNSLLIAQTWTSIDGGNATYGINSTTATNSIMPSCAVYNNELYAIWTETPSSGNTQIHIKKYNGTNWVGVGNTPGQSQLNASTYTANNPKLIVYNGYLYAAWNENDTGDPNIPGIHVKRYNGSAWTFVQDFTLGENRQNINKETTINAAYVDLAVYNGKLYAAWVEYANTTSTYQLRVAEFNGSLWVRIDGNGQYGLNYNTTNQLSGVAPSLCVYNNYLYVSWLEIISTSQLFVKRYDGSSVWTLIGGSGGVGLNYSTVSAYTPNLTLGNNKLYAFWRESNKVRVKQYDGSSWTTDPDGGTGWVHNGSGSYNPFGYIFANKNYIAWEENVSAIRQIRVVSFDGSTKTYIDGDGTTGINQNTAYTAIDPTLTEYNGDLYALWQEANSSSTYQIRAKKYPFPPIVESVSVPSNGTYTVGQTLTFTVNFSKDVVITGGTPYIPITLNTGGTVNASYTGGSGTNTLTFNYTVVSGNEDTDGILIGTAISSGGATLLSEDPTPLTANLTLNSVGSTTAVLVDGIAPSVSSINRHDPSGSSTTATSVIYRVSFNENVYNVNIEDFSLTTTGSVAGTIASVSASSGATIDVTINSISGNGTLRLDLKSTGTGITDNAGNPISGGFTTGQTYTIVKAPQVTTQAVSGIGSTNATGNGNIINLGYPNPTAHGVCWNTTGNPTISDSKVDNGAASATGSYTTTMNSLAASTLYYVRAYATNTTGTSYGDEVTFTTLTPNNAPTDIAITGTSINENVVANSAIGTLSSTDPDAGNTFTYTLEAGAGDTDNSSFNISGNSLCISNSPDFESKSNYSIRIRTTDQGSLTFEKAFTITINDLNETPTDITLSATSINENVIANSTIGTLSSTDPDAVNTFTYTLVAGTGSTDNASFNISSNNLRITASPDFETKSSYSVRIRTTDQGTLFYEKAFTITINDLNESPTDISLSATSINENVTANSTVGTFSSTDQDVANTFTYTLVSGTGSTDNTSFNISSSSLRITASPDFETKSSYSVRVRTIDQGNLTYEKIFTITINNVNETPTDISLSASAINENVVANTTVGALTSTDPDAGSSFTYTLVAGTGSTDNASFNISSNNLRINASPDFETKSSYSVRIRTTDQGTLWFEKVFIITINDLNEAPTNISISASSINENVAANSTVGTFSSTDQDIVNTFTYTLVPGTGSTDNASFNISESSLRITSSPNYEAKSSYTVRVRTTDQGNMWLEKAFTITINNLNESPIVTASQNFIINENPSLGTIAGTVIATDPDAGTTFSNWSITNNANPDGDGTNAFAINATTGQITIADQGDFDREANASLTIKVTVSDGTNTSVEESVVINLNDVNDVIPVITALQEFHVTEASPNGTVVGTVTATDLDITATTFQNWAITAGNSSGYFSINSFTGIISVADNTGLNYNVNPNFTLTLTVSDGANTSLAQTVSIIVNAVNDENPVITASQSFAIDENSTNITTVGQVLATDPDYGTVFQNWTITGGNTNNAFAINSTTGVITVNNSSALDYESIASLSLTIQVSDGVHTGSGVVIVNLNNLNDNSPTVTGATFSIDENTANSTSITTITGADADGTLNNLTYSIILGNTNNAFAINSATGEITVNNSLALDYESAASFALTIQVSDGVHTGSGVVIVNLNNLNDNAPTVTGATFSIDENTANSTSITTITGADADGTLNNLTYSIILGNTNNAFAINSATGEITVNNSSALDYESIASFALTIQVSDGANTGNCVITANLNNLNDNSPTVTGATFSIDENTANSTSITTITGADADGTLNNLTYSIILGNTNNAYAINSATGEITVNNSSALDYESAASFALTIQVSDGVHTGSGVVIVNLNNLNDNAPTVTAATFTIDENSENGTAVGTVVATDADGTLNSLTYSISAGNTNNAFAINSSTGAITVNKAEEINFEVTPAFNLTVEVSDGTLSGNAAVRINLTDIVETSIDDNKSFSFKVYPNPAVDKANISLSNLSAGFYKIEILNTIGNKVYQKDVNSTSEIQTIELTGFAEGIYFIRAYNKQFSFTEKLVIHK